MLVTHCLVFEGTQKTKTIKTAMNYKKKCTTGGCGIKNTLLLLQLISKTHNKKTEIFQILFTIFYFFPKKRTERSF